MAKDRLDNQKQKYQDYNKKRTQSVKDCRCFHARSGSPETNLANSINLN